MLVVIQDFDWFILFNVIYEMVRNYCLSMIEMSKVVLVCVNVIGMVDIFDFCIMEVKVSCNIFINLMLYILFI